MKSNFFRPLLIFAARLSLLISALFSVVSCLGIGSDSEELPFFHVWYELEGIEYTYDIYDHPTRYSWSIKDDLTKSMFFYSDNTSEYFLELKGTQCGLDMFLKSIIDTTTFIEGEHYQASTIQGGFSCNSTSYDTEGGWLSFDLNPSPNIAYTTNLEMPCNGWQVDNSNVMQTVYTRLSLKVDVYEKQLYYSGTRKEPLIKKSE